MIRHTLPAILVLVLLPGIVSADTMKAGQSAPAFSTRTIEGKPLRLQDLRGKVVILDFWTPT